jgi:phospholipid/cholesterol/gamma-HCH transport system permease protein
MSTVGVPSDPRARDAIPPRRGAPDATRAPERSATENGIPEGTVARLGDMGIFAWRLVREARHVRPYFGEVVRQAGIIVTGSTMIILFVLFLLGSAVGQESSAVARALGASPAAANFGCIASTEAIPTFSFGYILAAKVGCGIVAELGAMRVQEEIDAIEVMGVRSFAYLVGTRFYGTLLVVPFIYLLSIAASEAGMLVNSLIRYHDVSPGTFTFFCFNAIKPRILFTSFIDGLATAFGVLTIALYYGWKVRGGAVEVGVATARSMAVNIIFCTALYLVYALLFVFRPFVSLA